MGFGELLQLGDDGFMYIQNIEFEEGLRVHLVWSLEIGEEAVDHAVGQNPDPSLRDAKVSIELRRGHAVEVGADSLTLE